MKHVVLALLAACGGARPVAEPPAGRAPARPAPAGFAESDLIAFGDGVLSTYAIRRDALVKLGEVRLAPPAPKANPERLATYDFPLIGDWADRDHLFVRTGDRQVVMVTAAGITDVALPDKKTLEIPHPEETGESGYGGKQYTYVDLVVEDGEAWWSRCPYSYGYDGGFCFKWVNAKLWPTTELEVTESERIPREFPWREEAPTGFTLDPPKRPKTCMPPGGKAIAIPNRLDAPKPDDGEEEDYYAEHLFDARWVSASPPKLLATYGYVSEFAPPYVSKTALFDGCAAAPSWTADDAPRTGPDGLWEAGGDVFRGGRLLGTAGGVRFRPSR